MSERLTTMLDEAYRRGKDAALSYAADIATHRYYLTKILSPQAADAVWQSLPDAIRNAASKSPWPARALTATPDRAQDETTEVGTL